MIKAVSIVMVGWLLIGGMQFRDSNSQAPERLGLNWEKPAYDTHNTGFNPQREITKENVRDLELKWIYQAPERLVSIPGARVARGIHAPPLAINGILFFITESNRLTALNTLDGKETWNFQYDLGNIAQAQHWSFFQTQNSISFHDARIWMQTNDCNILAFDPFSGQPVYELPNTCVDIPGNDGTYSGHYAPEFFETILLTRASAGGGGGRSFIAAYDSFNQRLLWRWFAIPPTGGDPEWSVRDATKGNISPFRGDWGESDLIGGGSVFSLIAVDEESNTIYFPTGAPAMNYDASLRPGPNLFTDSIVALDANTGEMRWYYQTTPHDINGHEPTRSIILADAEVGGEKRRVVIVATRGDYVYVLDARSGELLLDPISFGAQKINVYNVNKGNEADFHLSQAVLVNQTYCPGEFGGSSTIPAFAENTVYVASQTFCSIYSTARIPYKGRVIDGYITSPAQVPQGSFVSAIDLSNGGIIWTFPMENRYQGGITVSGGVVYLVDLGGNFYALNAETGDVLRTIPMNGDGNTSVILAANARGDMMVFVTTGGTKTGVIAAFGLPQGASNAPLTFDPNIVAAVMVGTVLVAAYLIGLRVYNRRRGRG